MSFQEKDIFFSHTIDDEWKNYTPANTFWKPSITGIKQFFKSQVAEKTVSMPAKTVKRKFHRTKISSDKVHVRDFVFLAHPQPIIPF